MSKFKKVFLDEIVENFDSVRIPLSGIERDKIKDKKYPYYGAQGIIDYVDKYLFDGEYILVAEDGNNLKTQTNNVCTYTNGRFWVNNHAHIIKSKNSNNNRYIYYLLNLVDFKKYVTGSAQPKLTQDNLNKIELTIHDVENQDKIANILSSLDSKIELNNKINKELESMAKTLYDYWFVQFDFPDINGKPYKSSGGKMVYNQELKREIPDGWEVKKLGDYAEIKRGDLITAKETLEGNIKVVAAGINYSYLHSKSNREKNTITISGSGANAGYINFWREPIFASDCTTVRGKNDIDTIMILHHLSLLQDYIYSQAKGSAQPHVYPEDIKQLYYVVPYEQLLNEYKKIVLSSNDKVAINQQQNQKLVKLRDWLLPMLMNGQVSVKDA